MRIVRKANMRKHSVIIGSLTAIMAFGSLYLLFIQETPQLIRWYCEGQVRAYSTEIDVDSCIESHKNMFSLGTSNQ
jgi:hypothetical protein